MILRRCIASFGGLDRAELCFHAGLNVITAPNEAGKSTWSAFLLAMFYGIDTAERARAGTLPAKNKFRPWNGAPMEGRVELLWQGREITIERTSSGRTPLGKFRAYETQSGLEVPQLTAENCGLVLLGVERSVFERSAFVRQSGMAVTSDGTLEQRLRDLVTTADETVSYEATAQTLRALRNRCMSNRANGLIPQTQAQLAHTEQRLEEIHQLHHADLALRAQQAALSEDIAHLERQLQEQARQQADRQQRQLESSAAALEQAQRRYQDALQASEGLPTLAALQSLRQQWHDAAQQCYSLPSMPQAPEPPEVPRGFADALSAQNQAAADVADLEPCAPLSHPLLLFLLAALALAAGIALLAFQSLTGLIFLACSAVLAGLEFFRRQRNSQAVQQQAARAAEIAARYGTTDREQILRAAAEYAARQSLYEEQNARYLQSCAAVRAQQEAVNGQLDRLQQQIHALWPQAKDPQAAIEHAMERCRWTQTAASEVDAARRQLEALQRAVGTGGTAAPLLSAGAGSEADRLRQMHLQLQQLNATLAQHAGRVEAIGDPAALQAQKEQMQDQLVLLEEKYRSIDLAMQALEQAEGILQTQFSPQITKTAGELIARLTQSRYDTVLLEKGMAVSARQADEVASHPLAALSGGTMDQMYLAVRLAICTHVLPKDAPLILDDALVYFDDVRMAQAMRVLQDYAQSRQVLLFSCQSREADWAKHNL